MKRSSYLYGITDDKYIKAKPKSNSIFRKGLHNFKFRTPSILQGRDYFDHNDLSLPFKTSPETLLELSAKILDAIPLPKPFTWTIEDICRWLRQYGYPQYQHTFRENLINGRTLILVDASALCAMNITNFEHIQHIAYGIRCLYFFEMTKFGRSISLAPEYHMELYKLFRVKTGPSYDNTKRSDLWRRMQLIRENKKYRDHWDTLEAWLRMERDPKYPELFGGVRRANMYKCKQMPNEVLEAHPSADPVCKCMPPCLCSTSNRGLTRPWRLSTLPFVREPRKIPSVLTLLRTIFPNRYGKVLQVVCESRDSYMTSETNEQFKICSSFIEDCSEDVYKTSMNELYI